jgi:hypothetical protein
MTMAFFPVFLSVVFVFRNQAEQLEEVLRDATTRIAGLVGDYELIVIDNASTDASVATLKRLTGQAGIANVQVYALTKAVDRDTASWVGLENALGDFIAVVPPLADELSFLPTMLERAVSGADVVFANNTHKRAHRLSYRLAAGVFTRIYQYFNGVHLADDAPPYRVLSKKIVNFLLQHPQPAISYRHLPASAGFAQERLSYSGQRHAGPRETLRDGIERGMRMLVSTTKAPMRLVTALCMFGAVSNLVYSAYVLAIAFFKDDVAAGWVSLSLQQSGMFFLLSLVLLVLGEYILQMASLSNEGPLYYVAQELSSERITRRARLNIEDGAATGTHDA